MMQTFLRHLHGVRKSGNGFVALCPVPAHDDHDPSLSVTEKDGKILLHCFAGCSTDDVLKSLGLGYDALYNDDAIQRQPQPKPQSQGRGTLLTTYIYVDEQGEPLHAKERYDPKRFVQCRIVDGQWIYKMDGTRYVLYNLPDVSRAISQNETVYLVEGEKDADNLNLMLRQEFGSGVATCIAGGAGGKWYDSYTATLRGADVILCPDNDDKGLQFMRRVARELRGVCSQLREINFGKVFQSL